MRFLVCHVDEIDGPIPLKGTVVQIGLGIWVVNGHSLLLNDIISIAVGPWDIHDVPFGHEIRQLPNVKDPTR